MSTVQKQKSSSRRQSMAGRPIPRSARIGLQVADGLVRVEVAGALDAHAASVVREVLLDACDLSTGVVVLDLDAVSRLDDGASLPHLLDEAQRRCWAARCSLQVTATHPEVLAALADAGM
ncbi:hypothetical protein F1D05_29890 [Kribbella qitaiheensis]|uniref:STAS domain-containing protein n=1 Tax=Kribbella qitaiheensis TaxID=1544730 RepID=A0A7G6X548_9ACTN|nr:STAS domain-containing protein [Kribbella qitaiheensis]QNE21363.1 hypothetical protein F1D05_29890 [Kribbella qitaiheensis]